MVNSARGEGGERRRGLRSGRAMDGGRGWGEGEADPAAPHVGEE